jgi:hypothetical protein
VWDDYYNKYEHLRDSFEKLTEQYQFHTPLQIYKRALLQTLRQQQPKHEAQATPAQQGQSPVYELQTVQYIVQHGLQRLQEDFFIYTFQHPQHSNLKLLSSNVCCSMFLLA